MRLPALAIIASINILPAQPGPNRDELWRADVLFLATELPQRHPGFFSVTPRADFDAARDEVLGRIPDMTDAEVVVALARLAAMGRDAHTSVNLRQSPSIRPVPLRVRWFPEGWHVVSGSAAYANLLGRRVLRVGELPVEEAFEQLKPVMSFENEWWARSQAEDLLVSPDVLHALRISRNPSSVQLTVESAAGTEVTQLIQPSSAPRLSFPQRPRPVNPLHLRYADREYWFDYLPDIRALYFKYNLCRESAVLPVDEFSRSLAQFAASNPVEGIIIDLRHNTGGNSALLARLTQGLSEAFVAGTFVPRFVVAFIGRQTFSSGMLNAIDLKTFGATLIGEPTGGKPNGYGEVQSFQLPNSRLSVQYSTRLFQIPGFRDSDPSLMPDIQVVETIEQFLSEQDPLFNTVPAVRP